MVLFLFPGLVAVMVLGLAGLLLYSWDLGRRPVMFAQATVTAVGDRWAAFRLFDGQILELKLGRNAALRVGDYGRLTYRAGRFLKLE